MVDQTLPMTEWNNFGLLYYYHDTSSDMYKLSAAEKIEYCKLHKYTCIDASVFSSVTMSLLEPLLKEAEEKRMGHGSKKSFSVFSTVLSLDLSFETKFEDMIASGKLSPSKVLRESIGRLSAQDLAFIGNLTLHNLLFIKRNDVFRLKTERQLRLQFKQINLINVFTNDEYNELEWILFLDIDTVIKNKEENLSDLVERLVSYRRNVPAELQSSQPAFSILARDVFFIVGEEDISAVNSGVFLVRNNPQGLAFVVRWREKFLSQFRTDQQALNSAITQQIRDLPVVRNELQGSLDTLCPLVGKEADLKTASSVKYCSELKACIPGVVVTKLCGLSSWGGIGLKGQVDQGSKRSESFIGRYFRFLDYIDFAQLYLEGDFVVHFAGQESKLGQMKKAIHNLPFFS